MFRTLKQRLLFWFLIFISSNLVFLIIGTTYLYQREKVADVVELIGNTRSLLLEDYKNQLNFFTQEIRNPEFFTKGESNHVVDHEKLFGNINRNIGQLMENEIISAFSLRADLNEIQRQLGAYDSTFSVIIEMINRRGFKDFNLIGQMRDVAHELEQSEDIDPVRLLSLRRHEKDFLIRNETTYLRKHEEVARGIRETILNNRNLSKEEGSVLISTLEQYLTLFSELVEMDQKIGINNNSGIKLKLDMEQKALASLFDAFLKKADLEKEAQFEKLKLITLIVIVLFITAGVWISYFTAGRITRPLTGLTSYISDFVDSNFTLSTRQEFKSGKNDEITRLNRNFNVMRDKIIEQLQFFKEKVDERTRELAEANQRLIRLNEANSRFVPREFLEYLKRESIEQVQLGDNVQQQMTVMFSDIRSFTRFSESMSPEENFSFINSYLKETVPQVKKHHGFVDKYIGDSVMALFPGAVENALDSAIDSQLAVQAFNRKRKEHGLELISVGIGMHVGGLILGTIGEETRMETTVISDVVNTASRMEGLNSIYGGNIIISQDVLDRIKEPERYTFRFLDTVLVKGKTKAIGVYEVLDGLPEEEKKLKIRFLSDFEQAIDFYRKRLFEEAKIKFEYIYGHNPYDEAARFYATRSKELMLNGVSDSWEASEKLRIKRNDEE